MLPLTLDGIAPTECLTQAHKIMIELDISHLANKRIYEISGGEAQRVAIGRARFISHTVTARPMNRPGI